MPVKVLDGRSLAAHRAPVIAAQAERVRSRRGRAPCLLIMAFADERGRVPHVHGKLRACHAVGIDAVPVILGAAADTQECVRALQAAVSGHRPDAVFVQVPFPASLDGGMIESAIPVEADVDIMTPARAGRYLSGADDLPPLTVTAALLLLDAYAVPVEGLGGIVIADESPFARMLHDAFQRRGAALGPLVDPRAPDLTARALDADLVVSAAARPGLLTSDRLARGAVVIDAGYFNEAGRGDIDLSAGIGHLAAVAPVPGGIGPMTVSALLERVVLLAAGRV
jgi:methylenetetrahydrofolate dehydrogenase (NADP+) / methenyltetrahydrofolate cyclohydrolase